MINAVVFSGGMEKLLIKSLELNAPGVFDIKNFSGKNFKSDLIDLLADTDLEYTVFFRDRDLLYRSISEKDIANNMTDEDVFCFSLRLGKNVTHCESLNVVNVLHNQQEEGSTMKWEWPKHYLDFGYPLSLNGHVFRTSEIKKLIKNTVFNDAESLEAGLQMFESPPWEKMASYTESALVSAKDYHTKDFPSFNKIDFTGINSVKQDMKEMSDGEVEKKLDEVVQELSEIKHEIAESEKPAEEKPAEEKPAAEEPKKNKIQVVIPFYNPGEFLDMCIGSVTSQKFDNFEMIFIDDCSTDGSFDKIPTDDDRIKVIRNTERKTALENIHTAVMEHCDPDDIVVTLDGDDWLPNKKVLDYINDYYNEHDCWIMYGQANWTDGRRGFASAYTPEEFANVRKAPFRVSHIRTWRAGIFQKVAEQDPDFKHMKDSEGNFFRMSYDTAIMFSIMELAGYDKVKFNDEILYIYNRSNPISEDKVDQAWQWAVHKEVSEMTPLKQVDSYK